MPSLSRFLRSPLFPVFLIVFSDMLGVGMVLPVLPLFARDSLGASAAQIALLPSVFFAAQFIAAPRLGRWSDRTGRKPVLVFSQFGTLLAMLLTAWAPNLWIVYLARVFDGLTAGNVSVALAYVGDVAEPDQRTRAMGVINAGFGAGFMCGPALGGAISAAFGPRVPFLAAAGMSALSIVLSYVRLREVRQQKHEVAHPHEREHVAEQFKGAVHAMPGLRWMLATGFGMQLAMLTFTSTWVLWADDVLLAGRPDGETQRLVGYVFALIGLCGVLTQAFLVGPAVHRFGERKLIMGGLWLRSFGFTLMASVPRVPVTFASVPFASLGGGLAVPSLNAAVSNSVPQSRRGQAMGTMNASENLGRVLGPVMAGLLYQHVSPSAPIFTAATLCVLTSLLVLRFRRLRGEPRGKGETVSDTPPSWLDG